jgi:surfeit locus 1 family protein
VTDAGAARAGPRPLAALVGIGLAAAFVFAALVALGVWQLQRREWKHALIAQVNARVHARPVAAPGPAAWPAIGNGDAYRRVAVDGAYLPGRDTLVQAVTELGPGWWVLTPLRDDRGFTVLVNRGFVPSPPAPRPATGMAHVTGLLRLSEPKGGFLHSNDPRTDRWYSRDVTAIAAARQLGIVAPYFIDAAASPDPGAAPVGGLTVVRFPDNHLQYALTWFALALLLAGGMGYAAREEMRARGR